MTSLVIRAHGRPAAQGSKNKGRGGRFYEASRYFRPWRTAVVDAAKVALANVPEFDHSAQNVQVDARFYIERPKRHHVACDRARPLRENAPGYCSTTPDLDKVVRAVLDGLTQAGVIADDRRVVRLTASKVYAADGNPPGALILVKPIDDLLPIGDQS